jgi:hypothetical protein
MHCLCIDPCCGIFIMGYLDYIDRAMYKDLERIRHGLVKFLSLHLPGRTGENHGKPQSVLCAVLVEIWTEHLQNTGL